MPETTGDEQRAIEALERLARRWPRTLTLLSYDGSLSVVHTADRDTITDGNSPRREDLIIANIDGIPNDGGAW